jgi:hypothetical protein
MDDDGRTGSGSGSEDESGSTSESEADEGASVEIPIANGEGDRDEGTTDGVEIEVETGPPGLDAESESSARGGIDPDDAGTGGLFDSLDRRLLDLLSRGLETETHLRVYLAVRNRPWSTPEDVAVEAGLYPGAVRDALEALEARGALERRGPAEGTDPSREPEYAARDPGAVLTDAIGGSEPEGTGGSNLGRYPGTEPATDDSSPIRIDVEDDATDSGTEESDGNDQRADDGRSG